MGKYKYHIDGDGVTKDVFCSLITSLGFDDCCESDDKKSNLIYKKYRQDKGLWEEKRSFFGLFNYYVYKIFNGKLRKYFRLFKHKKALPLR